jgi:hypothetical protein
MLIFGEPAMALIPHGIPATRRGVTDTFFFRIETRRGALAESFLITTTPVISNVIFHSLTLLARPS